MDLSTFLLLVYLAVAGLIVLTVLVALHRGREAWRAELRAQGCRCEAGDDGFHLAGCPLLVER